MSLFSGIGGLFIPIKYTLTGKYNDVMDYARMCVSCHRAYDKKRRELTRKTTINVKRKS